jgi:hypothetical protein
MGTGSAAAAPAADGPARAFAWALCAGSAAAAVGLAVAGAPFPALAPLLVLGLLVALSVNHLAVFPSEWSATGEVAVLVAAVVGFASEPSWGGGEPATLLGPLAIGACCGVFDVSHWQRRAFWRMAYNSGNRMAAALPAALVFTVVARDGATWHTFLLAALATSLVFALVDLALFVVFERVRSGSWSRAAAREGLSYDCLSVPLGLFGSLAGWLATELDWWVAGLVLLPVPFIPELLLVRARRALGRRSLADRARAALPTVVVAIGLLAVVALALPLPSAPLVAGIAAVAVLAGAEFSVDRRRPVAAMSATVVVAGAIVGGTAALAGSAMAAIVATATAVVASGASLWWAPVAAGFAALASTALFDAHPTVAIALATAVVYQLIVLSRPSRVVWTAPVVAGAVAFASTWKALHGAGAFVFAAGVVGIAAGAALFGAPAWRSRVLGAWSRHATRPVHRAIVVAAGTLALVLATVAIAVASTTARAAVVPAAAACACAGAAMAMSGVRQWRFAPFARVRDATVVAGCAVGLLLAYLPLALDGNAWSIAIIGVTVAVNSAVAWLPARLAEAGRASVAVPDREPVHPR